MYPFSCRKTLEGQYTSTTLMILHHKRRVSLLLILPCSTLLRHISSTWSSSSSTINTTRGIKAVHPLSLWLMSWKMWVVQGNWINFFLFAIKIDYSQTSFNSKKFYEIVLDFVWKIDKQFNSSTFSMCKVYAKECAEASWICADVIWL